VVVIVLHCCRGQEKAVRRGVWFGDATVRFMLVMAPIVFVVNGVVSGVWSQGGDVRGGGRGRARGNEASSEATIHWMHQ